MKKVILVTFYDFHCTGLRILASCLKKAGFEVKMCFIKGYTIKKVEKFKNDYLGYCLISSDNGQMMVTSSIDPITVEEKELFYSFIAEEKPDIVGFSFRSYLNELALSMSQELHKRFTAIKTICGGFGPSLEPEKFIKEFDAVIRGEGEEAIVEVCNAFINKQDISNIKNVSCYVNCKIIHNDLRKPEIFLSNYPKGFCKNDGNENFVYIYNNKKVIGDPYFYYDDYKIVLGRGCVGSCSYCSGGNWLKSYKEVGYNVPARRMRTLDDIFEELHYAKREGVKAVHVFDEYFVAPYTYLQEFLIRYEKEINLPIKAYLHPVMIMNHLDLLDRLINIGLRQFGVGIQSGCQQFAKDVYYRKVDHNFLLDFAKLIHSKGANIHYHIITGNPLETEDNFRQALNFYKEVPYKKKGDLVTCFKFMPFPKSPIVEKYGEKVTEFVPFNVFERQSYLSLLRFVMNDEEFNPLLENKDFVDNPEPLKKIFYERFDIN